jgi:hypothetical protein
VFRARCRHCAQEIVQHPNCKWVVAQLPVGTQVYGLVDCFSVNYPEGPRVDHEPMPTGLEGEPKWIESKT